ncbi:hypothetical protein [Bauldia litoralis]|uniref:Uncharacterized protein n=1 Tax=Bauldia litoralis TaxID=665467 RepID=A0A1G6B7H6_9HYPH|nr:hypothetical protein [Bauldia litoralis]SDB16600.1 hypothetical protein SAMN02982931_01320 [Bauldia litoralis]
MFGEIGGHLLSQAAAAILASILLSFLFSIRLVPINGVTRLSFARDRFLAFAGIAVPLAVVAFATGYLTGLSRQPAVTATIPAVLTLIGGVFAYVSAARPEARAPMGLGIILFALILVLSTNYYSAARESGRLGRLLLLSEQEKMITTRRANMNLQTDFPAWMLTGEPSR